MTNLPLAHFQPPSWGEHREPALLLCQNHSATSNTLTQYQHCSKLQESNTTVQQLLWEKWPQFHGWDPGSSRWSCTQSPLLSWKVRYLFHSWAFKFSEQLQPCGAATPRTLHAGYCCQKALNVLSPVLYQTLTWPEDGSCSCWLCKTLLQNVLWQSGVLLTDRQIKHYLTSCLWVGNDYASIPNSNQTSRKVNLILPCPLIYCQQIACSAALISTVVVKLYEFKFFVLEREAQM